MHPMFEHHKASVESLLILAYCCILQENGHPSKEVPDQNKIYFSEKQRQHILVILSKLILLEYIKEYDIF